jgi:hypothetical protein
MKYLVVGSGGPGFSSAEDAADMLNNMIVPNFKMLIEWEKKKKISGGGVPVGDRALVFIAEAKSNDELDKMLRQLPVWGVLDWDVSPLQTFQQREKMDRQLVRDIKKAAKK